ncbi:acetylglutamate kinase [Symbiobacterium thermophilum]|uniref:Acetylglutamate kinase n=1 Tax=Symbiobacterium thermophilum (strain DSM 24528 / JCM 14929 / IAM 14863 / T) TaxID=292459 RepID=ARGB_SYMTH|nr:acetylglutamate kinase [Symbiobacterium thermophilum]Q67KD3.1 RecName: Full=Acetylglutamate kinase; AltName: Full=N-acetyl-L-glutamate 5-phosphotransferase; AltName: Full=NAG kinase; Short=NAGK [Symbiobacterium thermophilum IAM 14863]BAD41865.1 acetylglutamate kinase [Symbiobacterium thermophilum IAM 14863]
MDQQALDKAAVLAEALPYIREFSGKTVVIKYGGAAMAAADLKAAVMQDIALMKYVGMHPIVVHGGGPEVSELARRMGIEPQFVDGLRVTDAATMEIAQMVLVGKTNREIVTHLCAQGVKAVGLSGQDAGLIRAARHLHRSRETGEMVDLGFVGDVAAVDTEVLTTLTTAGYVPVIAPIGVGPGGQPYNINADTVAGAIAAAMKAEKLVLLTDVEGVRADKDDPSSLLSRVTAQEVKSWIARGRLQGGMIPKLQCCLTALEGGVNRVHIIDGRVPHSLLLEIFTDEGVGTMVVK